jgi:hypothetical protein
MTSLAHRGFVHLGMDVSKDSISVAVLHPRPRPGGCWTRSHRTPNLSAA